MVEGNSIQHLVTVSSLEDSARLLGFLNHLPVSSIILFAGILAAITALTITALCIIIRRRAIERRLNAQVTELLAETKANKTRHAFFGTISHDMRTPLNGILGFAELAGKSTQPAEIQEYVSKIRTSGFILKTLVDDTLTLSRIENGSYIPNPTPQDNLGILEAALDPIRDAAAARGVTLRTDTAGMRHRTVLADAPGVQKILVNLLSNAVKFTPAGGTVTFRCRLDPPGGGEPDTVITVEDTGIGISDEFLPHVFEPFAQEESGDTAYPGSGLGLTIVKSLIEAMHGTIDITSTRGKGTSVTVRLPLRETDRLPAGDERQEYAEVLRGKRVLVCEDNPLNLEIITKFLRHMGMEVTGVGNGRLGVETFVISEPGYFDIILVDLRMPVMDGITAAKTIRSLFRSDAKTVSIFAVSANCSDEDVRECLRAGMDGHIPKPINPKELAARLAMRRARA